jgi:hypothetical protein
MQSFSSTHIVSRQNAHRTDMSCHKRPSTIIYLAGSYPLRVGHQGPPQPVLLPIPSSRSLPSLLPRRGGAAAGAGTWPGGGGVQGKGRRRLEGNDGGRDGWWCCCCRRRRRRLLGLERRRCDDWPRLRAGIHVAAPDQQHRGPHLRRPAVMVAWWGQHSPGPAVAAATTGSAAVDAQAQVPARLGQDKGGASRRVPCCRCRR